MFVENFDQIVIGGFSLMMIVLGLVERIKSAAKLKGEAVKLLAMFLGTGFGLLYKFTTIAPNTPMDFTSWFIFGIFGLGMGLAASGVYDVNANKTPSE